ncbi:uncharacterized protein A4U43_C07F23770 [Asparagus officinalis]|uniref:Uncharacterized protein n=1 Tax=Asparagus officinalis TaxID=4686 RepID=A0A5P1EHE1_ASPOF|nr:uncharacterized protein A4U43_C07F23770 [Asparagus officinalis]
MMNGLNEFDSKLFVAHCIWGEKIIKNATDFSKPNSEQPRGRVGFNRGRGQSGGRSVNDGGVGGRWEQNPRNNGADRANPWQWRRERATSGFSTSRNQEDLGGGHIPDSLEASDVMDGFEKTTEKEERVTGVNVEMKDNVMLPDQIFNVHNEERVDLTNKQLDEQGVRNDDIVVELKSQFSPVVIPEDFIKEDAKGVVYNF